MHEDLSAEDFGADVCDVYILAHIYDCPRVFDMCESTMQMVTLTMDNFWTYMQAADVVTRSDGKSGEVVTGDCLVSTTPSGSHMNFYSNPREETLLLQRQIARLTRDQ